MDAKYTNPDNDRAPWTSSDAFAPGAATHQGMVYAIQQPFTGELIYPTTGRDWCVDQQSLLAVLNQWCPYELREIDDADKRAKVCGVSVDSVRKGVKAIMLSKSLGESREIAQQVLDKGPWPLFYFTKNGKGGIRRKTYLDEVEGRLPTNLWKYEDVGHTDEASKEIKNLFGGAMPFDTPKPVRLMKRILDIASDKDSIVFDFFSGSAPMSEAVFKKNAEDGGHRRFMLVQIPERQSGEYATLCDVAEERVRRAGARVLEDFAKAHPEGGVEPPDVGFRVFRVDSSNLRDVRRAPGEVDQGRCSVTWTR